MERLGFEKVFYHTSQLNDFKNTGDCYPVHIHVGLTSYCCHRCLFCYSDYETADRLKNNTLDTNALLAFLREAKALGSKSVSFIGTGEPLLHPDIIEILREVNRIGLDIGISTNGSKLNEAIRQAVIDTATWIRFSVNAVNPVQHEKIHQIKDDFSNVVDNIKSLVKLKREKCVRFPTIGTQFVFFEHNFTDISECALFWKKIGVDYCELKPMFVQSNNQKTEIQAQDAEKVIALLKKAKSMETDTYAVYAKIPQYNSLVKNNPRSYSKCYAQSFTASVLADGKMYLCQNMEYPAFAFGSIYEKTLREIWSSEARQKVLQEIDLLKCPTACRNDPLNEILNDYLNPNMENHPNFI